MPFIGEISALITAFLWSGTSIAFTAATNRIGSLQLNINRMVLAAILLFLTILIADLDYSVSLYQIYYLVLSGVAGLVLGDSFLFKAFQYIGARIGMLLMALAPAISTILALIFLKETINSFGILGMIITLGGIFLVVLEKNDFPGYRAKSKVNKLGIFFGILGAFGQASGLILAKFAFEEGRINPFVATFIRISSSVIMMIFLAAIIRRYKNPIKLYSNNFKALIATVIGTIFGPFLGITFSLIAIEYTKVGIASTLMATVPVIMLPMVKYYYKETLSWRAISGAFLAVVGVAILFLRK
jgi:drug/metabolite transporter (DMT)-like permease